MAEYSYLCLYCESPFLAKRKDNVYCRRRCKNNAKDRRASYTTHKKGYCEKCGFIAEHRCQLDVDHIDGNHDNNQLSNLQTLCANCHRLKTHLNGDHLS